MDALCTALRQDRHADVRTLVGGFDAYTDARSLHDRHATARS